MSAETKQVLEMLKEGKITADDAEKLLDKLAGRGTTATESATPAAGADPSPANGSRRPQFLRILMEKPGHDQINMRLPLSLMRSSRVLALVPPRVTERLAEQGIDLGRFASMQELAEVLEKTGIDIDKGNGRRVRIFCE